MRFSELKWHQMTKDAVIEKLQTNAACGLSCKAARSRMQKMGKNTLFDPRDCTPMEAARPYLTDPILWLLLASAGMALFFSEAALGICTLLCLLIGIGFAIRTRHLQVRLDRKIAEYRVPTATVLRDGRPFRLSARFLVPGDLLVLRRGDIVPCDCRLLSQKDLTVRTLTLSQDGSPAWCSLPKDAEAVYPYGNEELPPNYQNMLYGGSRILEGEAYAIAVATGESTFFGAMTSCSIPAEAPVSDQKEPFGSFKPYLRIYSLFLILLLLPLTLIGCLTSSATHTVLGTFLSICALAGAGGYTTLSFCFSAMLQRAKQDCFAGVDRGAGAILKSERAMDTLAELSDVFVLGRLATSDGRPHVVGAMAGNQILDPGESGNDGSAWRSLCEGMLLALSLREEGMRFAAQSEHTDLSALFEELAEISGLDAEAMRLRFSEKKVLRQSKDAYLLSAKASGGVLLREVSSLAEDAVRRCTLYEADGRILALSPQQKASYLQFVRSAIQTGGHCISVTGEYKSSHVLFGVLVIGEEMQKMLPSVLEELTQSGVRVTFFLNGGEETLRYARSVPFGKVGDGVSFHPRSRTPSLRTAFEGSRVLYGVSQAEIAELIQELRKSGRRVGVIGNGMLDLPLLQRADLAIATDASDCHRRDALEGRETLLNADGEEQSANAAGAVRRYADVLLHRANARGGGLFALSKAISHCRAARYRMRTLLSILAASQAARLTIVLLGVLFGSGLLSASQILFSGLILEFTFVHWILSLPIPQRRLRRCPSFDWKRISKRAFAIDNMLPAGVVSLLLFLYTVLLFCFGILESPACASFHFVGLLLVQFTFFIRELLRNGVPVFTRAGLFHVGGVIAPLLLLIVASILLPPLQAGTGLGVWHWSTAVALLAVIPVTLLAMKLSGFFKRTAK